MPRPHPSTPPPPADHEIVLRDDRVVTLGEPLGRGTSATVYRGVLELPYRVRRAVACKVFDVVPSDSRDYVLTALARAVRCSALVTHPNVASIHELTVVGEGQPVVLSELVDGWSLEALVASFVRKGKRLPLDLGLFIATEIAEALAAARTAHTLDGGRREVVHHDLSAREVLLSRAGEVKVTDFGVSRALRAGSSVRQLGSLAARASSMAPEVVRGGLSDARSDVFSLGILLREMLVGPRFAATVTETEAVVLAQKGHVEIGVFEPQLPEPLAGILRRALEIDPKSRYPHAGALAYELRRASLSLGVGDGRFFLRSVLEDHFVRRRFLFEDDEPTQESSFREGFLPFVVERQDDTPTEGVEAVAETKAAADDDDLTVTNEVRVSGVVPTLHDDEDDDGFGPPSDGQTGAAD